MNETPTTKWGSGVILLLAAAALTQVDCSSSSSRGPGTGGMGSGTGGVGSGTGGDTGTGGHPPGECDGSYEPTGDVCLDAEQMYYACCFEDDFGACDSTDPFQVCVAACMLISTCDDLRAFEAGDTTGAFAMCGLECPVPEGEFTCDDGVETVPAAWVCDGDEDCSDGSDELYCAP